MRRVGTDRFEPIRIGFGCYGLIREKMTLMLTPHTHECPIHQNRTLWGQVCRATR